MKLKSYYRFDGIVLFIALLSVSFSCSRPNPIKTDVIPLPHSLLQKRGSFEISPSTKIIAGEKGLLPLADLLNQQIKKLSGFELQVAVEQTGGKNIYLMLGQNFEQEEYQLEISDDIRLKASNYRGLAMAVASLVQLTSNTDGTLLLPKVEILDKPDYEYRSVMLDLARFWHPIETIKETIDLLWLYKIKYLHLHLSDNRRFTFPLDEFPDLKIVKEDGAREYYTVEELKDLVEYARQRGVAIIPEIDLPGHSTQLWSKYPETFGNIDPITKKARPLYVINMAKEETYRACEKIINKLADVFYTSPYIHFGGDEVYLEAMKNVPEYEDYCEKNNLEVALAGNPNELFCHFINRMHNMVKATGKQSLVWEGFHGTGSGRETISKDITVIVWNASYNHPDSLVANGYKIVNATWIPWYMVGAMNLAPTPEKGYHWDVTKWSHWDDQFADIEIETNQSTIGGQICYWEQNHYKVIPVLRERVPVLAERLWNKSNNDDYTGFVNRYKRQNASYSRLFRPITALANNLLQKEDLTFKESTNITLKSSSEGEIKYTYSDSWNMPDMNKASTYKEEIPIKNSGVLSTQLYSKTGEEIGFPIQQYFQKIDPTYKYKVFGPAPNKGWEKMPNFSQLKVMREGVSGKMTAGRLEKINGELFAKVKKEGHIETRFNGLYNQYALELKGNLSSNSDSNYTIRIQTHDGLAELYIDNTLVAKGGEFGNKPEEFSIDITKGSHPFVIKYFYRQIQNQLSILYKTPEMQDFIPFEDLVLPLQ